jgi:hypothetical protein
MLHYNKTNNSETFTKVQNILIHSIDDDRHLTLCSAVSYEQQRKHTNILFWQAKPWYSSEGIRKSLAINADLFCITITV